MANGSCYHSPESVSWWPVQLLIAIKQDVVTSGLFIFSCGLLNSSRSPNQSVDWFKEWLPRSTCTKMEQSEVSMVAIQRCMQTDEVFCI